MTKWSLLLFAVRRRTYARRRSKSFFSLQDIYEKLYFSSKQRLLVSNSPAVGSLIIPSLPYYLWIIKMKSYGVTIKMKPLWQNLFVLLLFLFLGFYKTELRVFWWIFLLATFRNEVVKELN